MSSSNRGPTPTVEDLLLAARERAARRGEKEPGHADYEALAELLRRMTAMDAAGLGPELARLRHVLGMVPPQPPTISGRLRAWVARIFSPLFWKLLRRSGSADPLAAVYDMLCRQLEWQLALQQRLCSEITALERRVEALENLAKTRKDGG
jgi:hypothetical protein